MMVKKRNILLFLILLLHLNNYSRTQNKTAESNIDSLKDEIQSKQMGIDTIIYYSSEDSIVYSISNKIMTLYGNSNIKYKLMELKSEKIEVDWNTSILRATGETRTADTAGTKLIGTPIMIDGGEEYHGHELLYNFKTQKGKIILADTKSDEGFYYGSQVKKVNKDVLFIADGKYTTCEKENPHFYFQSRKMKLIVRDKIIAEPIYLYISDVPVFAIPFGVFPSKSGRRSGFFAPAYGDNAIYGRYLRKIGYYWALSDYYDIALHGDWYTNGSFVINSEFSYALRYYFNGGINGTYKKFITSEKGDPSYNIQEGYNLNIRHNHELNPWTRADVNFTFMSDNNYRLTNYLYEALQQTIVSNATLSRYWEGTPNSVSINISRTQQLLNGRIDELIPAITFNRGQSFPFRRKKAVGELKWYEQIGYSYRANFINSHSKIPITIENVKTINNNEILFTNFNTFRKDRRQNLSQGIDVNISPKFGYFTVTPNLSFRDERTQINNLIPFRSKADSSLTAQREKEFISNGNLNTGIIASTRLYGILQPNILGVTALRHTLSPSLSFSYSKQVYGKDIRKGQSVANLAVGNVFELKTKSTSADEEEKKIQLLNLGMNVSYNFSADSLNFSNINLSYRTGIGEILSFYGSTNFNLYQFDETAKRTINKFMISEGKLARLENFSLSLSTTLVSDSKNKAESVIDTNAQVTKQRTYKGVYLHEEPDFNIPWRLSLNWNFSESFIPSARNRSANVSIALDFNLTENWKFRVNGNYDLVRKEISAPQIQIDRDLHCWVMNFTWVPIGYYRNYRLEIRVKASQLKDIKITKQRMTF